MFHLPSNIFSPTKFPLFFCQRCKNIRQFLNWGLNEIDDAEAWKVYAHISHLKGTIILIKWNENLHQIYLVYIEFNFSDSKLWAIQKTFVHLFIFMIILQMFLQFRLFAQNLCTECTGVKVSMIKSDFSILSVIGHDVPETNLLFIIAFSPPESWQHWHWRLVSRVVMYSHQPAEDCTAFIVLQFRDLELKKKYIRFSKSIRLKLLFY